MILDAGLIDYEECYKMQKDLARRRRLCEIDDAFILAEHKSVFTIGRTGRRENLIVDEESLKKDGIKVLSVDRGGDITFHGPGQLVVYPIIDLKNRAKDLHRYLRDLEELIINFLRSEYSIFGQRLFGKTGVWVSSKKIAFIGIAASDWITYHGLSINVNMDLRYFSMIHPCGMKDIEVTSMSAILNRYVPITEVKEKILSYVNSMFDTCAAVA